MNSSYLAYTAHNPQSPLELSEFTRDPISDDEVEIAVEYCGLCHSDLAMIRNHWNSTTYPMVPGHEIIGTITATGNNVPENRIGERVAVGWYCGSCGKCHSCEDGQQSLCNHRQKTIVGHHGGFASSLRCHQNWAATLPPNLPSDVAAPLCCAGLTVYQAMMHAQVNNTARVGVIGIGGLGHVALQFLNKWGCHVTAFTTSPDKSEEALNMGAHHVIHSKDHDAMAKAAQSLDWILCTSHAPVDAPAWLEILAANGTLHFVGINNTPLTVPIQSLLAQKSITASTPGPPATMQQMLEFAAKHTIHPVIEVLPFSQINTALKRLEKGDVKYRFVLQNDLP